MELMKLSEVLKLIEPGLKIVAHLGIKRKHRPSKKQIEMALTNLLAANGANNFHINCYVKGRNSKISHPTNPDAVNIFFIINSDLKPILISYLRS